MSEVFFYHGASDKLAAACALIRGAHAQGKALVVYTRDTTVAGELDRMLWAQDALSFIPHCRIDSPLAAETPILIADSLSQVPDGERLMNLDSATPEGYERFRNLVEVVGQGEEDRAAARDRVKRYKEKGHEVRYFDLSQRA